MRASADAISGEAIAAILGIRPSRGRSNVVLEDDDSIATEADDGAASHCERAGMASYTAQIETTAPPEQVLAVLTEPSAIRAWSPVPFELDDDGRSLAAGTETRVSGNLGGVRVGFDVQVHAADLRGLILRADGPVALDVEYDVRPLPGGSEVRANVSLEQAGGLRSRLIGRATEALLASGALASATGRIARAAEGRGTALAA
jgi:hypothetical protein